MKNVLTGEEHGWWVISEGKSIHLEEGMLPCCTAEELNLIGQPDRIIGYWQTIPVRLYCGAGRNMVSVRQLLHQDGELFALAGRGVQLALFYQTHRWCGYCGEKTRPSMTEFACLCPQCHQRYYPQIAPCIIVAIRRKDKILLARHARHNRPIYTTLAGFVESGETLEQSLHREVMEESDLKVNNLRYVASQSWPFPHSLMVGFLADYVSGDIKVQRDELLDADWFHFSALPQCLPEVGTIARRLIEDTIALCRNEHNNATLTTDD